jgi:exonuclease SbcD
MLDVCRLLGGKFDAFVADRISQVALSESGQWQASKGWHFEERELPADARCVFSCLPSLNKGTLAARVGATLASEALGQSVAAVLSGFGVVNTRLRQLGVPTVGVAHGTVTGCLTEHGVPMMGLDHEFSVGALFAAQASAFLLGHIHRHQHWESNARRIAYPGSIGRLHYGEEGEKGFLIWDVEADQACFEFIATPARRMLHFDFAGPPDLDALKAKDCDSTGAFIRVRWNMPEEDRHRVDREMIRSLFAAAAEVKFEERVIPVVRARAAGITQSITLSEKLARWAETTGVEPEPLLDKLERLLSGSVTEIVQALIDKPLHETTS